MRAVVIEDTRLTVQDRPDPVPGKGQLLVAVEAAGVNGADLVQRRGFYPAPPDSPADIPGMECSGTVLAVGPGVVRHRVGDRVMSIVGGGAQAEQCLVYDSTAIRVPDGLSAAEAGGFPEVFTTAHDALVSQCGLTAQERLLVTGAAGGVGLAGVQLGRAIGATVTASVHRPEMRERVAEFAGVAVVAPEDEGDAGPYDVVLELVGAASLADHLQALAPWGRIVVIGVGATGSRTEVDLFQIMARRAMVRGSTLRSRPVEEKAATAEALERDTISWLERGEIRVPIEATFDLDHVEDAYERFSAGAKLGKVVLVPSSTS